jgi:hypothetical protein
MPVRLHVGEAVVFKALVVVIVVEEVVAVEVVALSEIPVVDEVVDEALLLVLAVELVLTVVGEWVAVEGETVGPVVDPVFGVVEVEAECR